MNENKTAMVMREGDSYALSAPGDFGAEHMRIVREAFAPTASQAEFEVMWAGAKSRGLDPVKKQIHFVKRRTKRQDESGQWGWADVWTSIVGIDGFRSIAESTGKYDGQDEPEFEYTADDRIVLARVRVYRKDISRPFVGVARWVEYVQTDRDGNANSTWGKMEHTMLAKCAEALALRKAFPEKLGGLYTGEEMAQAENETPAREWRVAAAKDHRHHTGHVATIPEALPAAPPSPPKPSGPDAAIRALVAAAQNATTLQQAEAAHAALASAPPRARAEGWFALARFVPADVLSVVREKAVEDINVPRFAADLDRLIATRTVSEEPQGDTGDTAGAAA